MWTIVFIVYSCFHTFFERVISDYLVEPFLSTFQDTVISRIIAIFIACVILMRLYLDYKNKERRLPCSQVYLSALVLIACFYYRVINNDVWNYVGIFNSDWIAYSDLVPFYCLANIMTASLHKRKPYEPNSENSFYIDNPITKKDEDMLGRTKFAESIARKTLDTQPSDGALTVGIVAPWGFGKTSFINMMKEYFAGKAIVINFSPWIYGKDKNLTQAFFLELNKAMKVYNRSLSEKLISYADLLDAANVPYMKFLSNLLRQGRKNSLESLRNDLELALKSMKEPIVVIIDDLDRLGEREIMEVMKIIRNSANFSNIRFIATYDREYVTNVLKDSLKPGNYLEKIFQVEYVLPNFDKQKLIAVLKDKLSFVEEKEELNDCFKSHKVAFEELTSLRDVKRFVNMFQLAYRNLKGEVVLVDLMNLIILKQKYTPVYNLLAKYNKRMLVFGSPLNYILYRKDKSYNNKTKIDIVSEWDIYLKGYDAEGHKSDIIRLLEKLFPSSSDGESNTKSIRNFNSIERYFHYTLLNEDYSSLKFNGLWDEDYTQIIKEIEENTPIRTVSLMRQIFNYDTKDKDKYKKIVRAIFYCGKVLNTHKFNKDNVTRIIERDIIEDKSECRNFIIDTMLENGPSRFVFEYLFSIEISNSEEWPLKHLSLQDSRDIRLILLEQAIEENYSFDDIYFYISRLRIKREQNPLIPSYHKNREYELVYGAKDAFINKYASLHKMEVIIGLIEKSGDKYLISNMAEYIWEDWYAYEDFVKSIEPKNEQVKEYLRFVEKQKASSFKHAVPFDFIYINVPNNTEIID